MKSTEVTVTVKPATPVVSGSSSSASVSGKTVTVVTAGTDFEVGTYTLYKGEELLATCELKAAGKTLDFTKVEGLEASSTNFQITVTVKGVTSDKSADITIIPA